MNDKSDVLKLYVEAENIARQKRSALMDLLDRKLLALAPDGSLPQDVARNIDNFFMNTTEDVPVPAYKNMALQMAFSLKPPYYRDQYDDDSKWTLTFAPICPYCTKPKGYTWQKFTKGREELINAMAARVLRETTIKTRMCERCRQRDQYLYMHAPTLEDLARRLSNLTESFDVVEIINQSESPDDDGFSWAFVRYAVEKPWGD